MTWIVAILIALPIGILIGYLLADRRGRSLSSQALTDCAVAQQKAEGLATQLQGVQAQASQLQSQLLQAGTDRAGLQAKLESTEQNLLEQRKLLDEAHQKLKDSFAELSRTALEHNAKSFLQLAEQNFKTIEKEAEGALETRKKEIETLLSPVSQTLKQYREELAKLEESRNSAYKDLLVQLTGVATTQKDLSVQTRQLVDSLRRPQTRGRWGELTLRRLFEMAGLANRCSFMEQVTVETSDGSVQRPDCIVKLPEDREIIIDSKVVIDAFLDSASAPDDLARTECLQRHARQVRKRVEELSKKSYWEQFAASADYVVMFLPGEAFLYAAIDVDPTLIEDALQSHVLIASPSTLLGLLRVIEMGWKQNAIEQNAHTIRELATDLYDRVRVMAEHFESLGESLSDAVSMYNKTLGSLERNVVTKARQMAELGVAGKKQIPELPEVTEATRELSTNTWKLIS